ncbi:MAG: pyridoxal phosphate-dependent aminotransferase [Eubacteriales bacterium]|nr:pyridoxal phosphate-dependent aminotransferase [Eubacteriales bacterium]
MQLNQNIMNLKPSASLVFMKKAKEMKAAGLDIVDLAGGEPDFDTPAPIIEEAYRQMKAGFTHYTVGQALPELMEKLSVKLKEENDILCRPDEIMVTPGGKNGIYLAVRAILNPGDEALYLDPAWVSYVPIIQTAAGVPVPVKLSYENHYRVTYEALKEKVTEKTKMLIINYPNNPTGKILSAEELDDIEKFMLENQKVILLSDEVYERIVFDGKKSLSPASRSAIRDRVVTVNGFSKSAAMTGWRLGYVAASREILVSTYKLFQHSLSCVSGFVQKAAIVALDCQKEMDEMVRCYEERRNAFIGKLNAVDGIEAELPPGAFYAWIKCSKNNMNSQEMCEYLLNEAKVVGVPGSSYGEGGEGCLRYSFANSMDALMEAADRIKAAMDKL